MNTEEKKKNPATGFLIMAAFNVLASIIFIVFYFLYEGSNGERSFYFLIAAAFGVLSAGGSLVAYNIFRKKLQETLRR